MVGSILLIDDDENVRFGLARYLERRGFSVTEASCFKDARALFGGQYDAVVTDFRLPDGDALDVIGALRPRRIPILVLTGYGSIDLAVRAVRMGAEDFLTKPVDLKAFVAQLQSITKRRPSGSYGVERSTPSSDAASGFAEKIARLKDSDCTLLVLGETGTGKTRLVRELHEGSRRSRRPFVDLNCAGLARDLVDSELFGHERGAFTSAHAAKPGMFNLAEGGTLFLDEVGDIDIAVQAKVLKVIEEKRFRRLGGARELHRRCTDRRGNAPRPEGRRSKGRLPRRPLLPPVRSRESPVPPLREQSTDILRLARELLGSLAAANGRQPPGLSPGAEGALLAHPWPGNVRELKNVLERALHFATGAELEAGESRDRRRVPIAAPPSSLRDLERAHIERVLSGHPTVSDAAKSLGISRSSMYSKVKAYGLVPPRGRQKIGGNRH